MKTPIIMVVLIVILQLVGCAASGIRITEDQLVVLQKGKTTVEDVHRAFGRPTSSTVTASGDRMFAYMYVEAQARPETFIPIVGGFIGGADSRSTMVTMRFDSAGVLQDFSSTTSEMGMGTGFASGTTFGRVDQPKREKGQE